jgi:hypothetical protein
MTKAPLKMTWHMGQRQRLSDSGIAVGGVPFDEYLEKVREAGQDK